MNRYEILKHPERQLFTSEDRPIKDFVVGEYSEVSSPAVDVEATAQALRNMESRSAVREARRLEDRALRCLDIAALILPGASEDIVEDHGRSGIQGVAGTRDALPAIDGSYILNPDNNQYDASRIPWRKDSK